jgi:hypothetical protein
MAVTKGTQTYMGWICINRWLTCNAPGNFVSVPHKLRLVTRIKVFRDKRLFLIRWTTFPVLPESERIALIKRIQVVSLDYLCHSKFLRYMGAELVLYKNRNQLFVFSYNLQCVYSFVRQLVVVIWRRDRLHPWRLRFRFWIALLRLWLADVATTFKCLSSRLLGSDRLKRLGGWLLGPDWG